MQYFSENMQFAQCGEHKKIKKIICLIVGSYELRCSDCFHQKADQSSIGVLFDRESIAKYLQWNQFLYKNMQQSLKQVRSKGLSNFFKVKVSVENFNALLSCVQCEQMNSMAQSVLSSFIDFISRTIQQITNASTPDQLNNPAFIQSLYRFYDQNAYSSLFSLAKQLENKVLHKFSDQPLYGNLSFSINTNILKKLQSKITQILAELEGSFLLRKACKQNTVLAYPLLSQKLSSQEYEIKLEQANSLLKLKQQSIRYLNNLIGNQEQQLSYRENEVQILTTENHKLISRQSENHSLRMDNQKYKTKVAQLQKSIGYFNKLISNSEKGLQYREDQVVQEIQKLIGFREQCAKIPALQQELVMKDKALKQLNNLIGNQEEQLAYRENEIDDLMQDMKKLMKTKQEQEQKIKKANLLVQNLKSVWDVIPEEQRKQLMELAKQI